MGIHFFATAVDMVKTWREAEEIEKKLHPLVTIEGILIQHKHSGQTIIFFAEVNGMPLNNRQYAISREAILESKNFYEEYRIHLAWLIKKAEQPRDIGR